MKRSFKTSEIDLRQLKKKINVDRRVWHGNAEKPLALKWTLRIILPFRDEAPQENPAVGNKGAWYCRDAKQTLALYPSLEPAKRLMESSAPHHHHQDICMELFTSQDRLCEDAPREKRKSLHIFQLILLAHKQNGKLLRQWKHIKNKKKTKQNTQRWQVPNQLHSRQRNLSNTRNAQRDVPEQEAILQEPRLHGDTSLRAS